MEWVSGNVMIRPNCIALKGDVIFGHAHNFDHTTIVFKGAMLLREVSGERREIMLRAPSVGYSGPSHALVAGGVFHEIKALEDDTIFWCVYAHRNPQGDVVQEYNGWRPAYETTLDKRPT